MFLWLGVALVVDAIDGPLARAANVAAVCRNWSGDTLDLVVDYTTYVFVPAYAVAAGGLDAGRACAFLPRPPSRSPARSISPTAK